MHYLDPFGRLRKCHDSTVHLYGAWCMNQVWDTQAQSLASKLFFMFRALCVTGSPFLFAVAPSLRSLHQRANSPAVKGKAASLLSSLASVPSVSMQKPRGRCFYACRCACRCSSRPSTSSILIRSGLPAPALMAPGWQWLNSS